MKKKPTANELAGMASIISEVETWPKNKPPGNADDILQIVAQAAQRAYHNKPGGYEVDEDGSLCGGMGDIGSSLDGWMFNHDELMCKVGAGVTSGIAKLVGDLDEDTANKVRRLVQVAVGGGYLASMLDGVKGDGRTRRKGTKTGSKKKESNKEKALAFIEENPDATQKEIAAAVGVGVRTIRDYLNS
jgi:hypothetical protein